MLVRNFASCVLLAVIAAMFTQCGQSDLQACVTRVSVPTATVAKWPGNKAGAISVNYDTGNLQGVKQELVRAIAESFDLRIDYELVSGNIGESKADFILTQLLPAGYDFFGHGREHLDHDALGTAWSVESAQHSRDTLLDLGIRPVAFAYPFGTGYESGVQQAIADAGFLSARLFAGSDPFIVPGDTKTPRNWFALPSLRMESLEFEGAEYLVNDTKELIPFLDTNVDRGSWLILTYHSIGEPQGWGYYKLSDFELDMQAIAERDLWVASLNDVTLYVYQYEEAELDLTSDVTATDGCHAAIDLSVDHNLDDSRFNLPMSVVFNTPRSWAGEAGTLTCPAQAPMPVTFTDDPAILSVPATGVTCSLAIAFS